MAVKVRRGGMLTTLQDLGRPGWRSAGVPVGGAMDPFALRVANLLVGNPEDAAALEMTLVGAELEFDADTVVALAGATSAALVSWRPQCLPAGTRLVLGPFAIGCRAYLAIAGGFDVPMVLGGRGTDLRGGWGGWQGRALRDGDELPVTATARQPAVGNWRLDPHLLPAYGADAELRVVAGAQAGEFAPDWLRQEFTVRPQSDRMGLRLQGEPLRRSVADELDSTAVVPGTVQVPADGQPIVLGVDAQTIGGYPQPAHVISADLPVLAQLRPGDRVRFRDVTLREAHSIRHARDKALAILRQGVADKYR